MNEINYFKSWIIFLLSSAIGGFLAAFLAGFVAGFFIAQFNPDDPKVAVQQSAPLIQLIGILVVLPISFICYKWTISKYILPQMNN